MKILLCHNYYQQRGGEDQSFEDEAQILADHGHDVQRYTRHNDEVDNFSRLAVAKNTISSRQTYRKVRALIRKNRPDVMHCTNTFPLISPAVYDAAQAEGVPIIQALRNYRLLCPSALFMRKGRVCEDCLGKWFAWPGVLHGCYRDSRAATAVVATMLSVHRARGTWNRQVNRYFTLTNFSRAKFIEGGLPAGKISVKPNFVSPDPGSGDGAGGYALFVGRISPEKGIDTLLAAWSQLKASGCNLPLKIIGDGPLSARVQSAAQEGLVEWLGRRSLSETLSIMGGAALLVMPSVWYETFGRTIIEAYAKGTPVVASRLGAMQELVEEGRTGFLFEPGNATDLASTVRRALADPGRLREMRNVVRHEYEDKYTSQANYRHLMAIYADVLASDPRKSPSPHISTPNTSEVEVPNL